MPNERIVLLRTLFMNKIIIVPCDNCGKDYGYKSAGNPYPGGKDRETAYCPYCNAEGPSKFYQRIHIHIQA